RELQADAAVLAGRASVNRNFATELMGFDDDPLAELGTAVDRVKRLAEAIAARRELERRELFEAATAQAAEGEQPPPELSLFDAGGRPAKPPVERNRRALGRLAIALSRCSKALAPQVAELSPAQLGALTRGLGEPWRDLAPTAGFLHQRLLESREARTKELLSAAYRAGRDLEAARAAESKRDVAAAFDASSGVATAEANHLRGELARIDEEIDEARRQGKGP